MTEENKAGNGTATEVRIMEVVRAIVRPVLTVGSLGAALLLLLWGKPVPDWLLTQTGTLVGWWFADRAKRE